MVAVLPADTPVPLASKMSILRPACYAQFRDTIDGVYDRYERGSGAKKVRIGAPAEMRRFVRGALGGAIGEGRTGALRDDADLFAAGVDSLQAGRVRNACQMRLELGGATLGQNSACFLRCSLSGRGLIGVLWAVVYEHPSINKYVRGSFV
jgi:hypothetical protein